MKIPGSSILLAAFLVVQAPPGTRLEGIVADGVTDRPIPLATVQIAGLRVSTDQEGRYAFDSVPPGQHILSIEKSGYLRARQAISSGQVSQPVSVRLFPPATVSGQILDTKGDGIRTMLVVPYRLTYDAEGASKLVRVLSSGPISPREIQGSRSIGTAGLSDGVNRTGQTDDRGMFRISNLSPGRYAFYMTPMTNDPPDPGFYPGVLESDRAEVFELKNGEQVQLRPVTLANSPQGKLRVRIIDQTGQGSLNAFVQVRRKGQSETLLQAGATAGAASAECGSGPPLDFTCPVMGSLAPGSYEVEAVLTVRNSSFIAVRRVHLDMTEKDIHLDLPVSAGPAVSGDVILKRADGATSPAPALTLSLRSNETLPNVAFNATSDAAGAIRWSSIPEGAFRVQNASGIPAGQCLDEVRQDNRDLLREDLIVTGRGATLRAVLVESQVALTGEALTTEGKKAPGALVVLIPDDRSRTEAYVSGIADQNGMFEITCIRPGAYRLFAWPELEGAAYRNAEFMKQYDGQGQPVNVQAAGRITVNAVVRP